MKEIRIVGSGLVWRNPKPHVRSRHAYFPSLAHLGGRRMACSMAIGQAFEAADVHSWIALSEDDGAGWSLHGELFPPPEGRAQSDCCRITALPEGGLVAAVFLHDRRGREEEGLANPANLGFVPTALSLRRSADGGRSWGAAEPLRPPVEGPSFELCSPIVVLSDGRWVLPTSTWRGWNGACPGGMRMVAFVSPDRGAGWPSCWEIMDGTAEGVIHWESKIAELADGRLLAVAWAFDEKASRDLPNRFAVSGDGGARWSRPLSTGLSGQTTAIAPLADGGALVVYRRLDRPGLWAETARVDGERWIRLTEAPLWGARGAALTAHGTNMVENFNVLRFGAPSLVPMSDGTFLCAFWCYEDCVSGIRWIRLSVD
jgi:sialidase-1